MTAGYVANPEANAQSFFGDGWFRTGDRGRFDATATCVLEGRIKELIIRGGENISPFEIEAVLLAAPARRRRGRVRDPGREVRRRGRRGGRAERRRATRRRCAHWCRERLAAFKVPKQIFVLDEIPRTPTGKLQRARIGAGLLGGDP